MQIILEYSYNKGVFNLINQYFDSFDLHIDLSIFMK